ncbi:MAG: signal recognition particle receptor subunit alpha, partial [Lentilitoribacter sp.]
MEFVQQLITFLTPYLGEYARYAPIAIGLSLSLTAIVIRRRFHRKMAIEKQKAREKATAALEAEKANDIESLQEGSSQVVEPIGVSTDGPVVAETPEAVEPETVKDVEEEITPPQAEEKPSLSWAQRIKSGLSKTRSGLGSGLASIVVGSKKIDDDLMEELETQLLMADVGLDATQALMQSVTDKLNRKELKDSNALLASLKADMGDILANSQQELVPVNKEGPFVILMVGVNGVGKTTT